MADAPAVAAPIKAGGHLAPSDIWRFRTFLRQVGKLAGIQVGDAHGSRSVAAVIAGGRIKDKVAGHACRFRSYYYSSFGQPYSVDGLESGAMLPQISAAFQGKKQSWFHPRSLRGEDGSSAAWECLGEKNFEVCNMWRE